VRGGERVRAGGARPAPPPPPGLRGRGRGDLLVAHLPHGHATARPAHMSEGPPTGGPSFVRGCVNRVNASGQRLGFRSMLRTRTTSFSVMLYCCISAFPCGVGCPVISPRYSWITPYLRSSGS